VARRALSLSKRQTSAVARASIALCVSNALPIARFVSGAFRIARDRRFERRARAFESRSRYEISI
jgi:hypothetical protein